VRGYGLTPLAWVPFSMVASLNIHIGRPLKEKYLETDFFKANKTITSSKVFVAPMELLTNFKISAVHLFRGPKMHYFKTLYWKLLSNDQNMDGPQISTANRKSAH
jgi:hypothetical protein